MVKQSQQCVHEHHDTLIIHNTPTGRRQIPYPTFSGPMHIIGEWEERITRTTHSIQLTRPFRPLLCCQWSWNGVELTFPLRLFATIERLSTHEQVDRVGFFGALNAFFEG